ncbi:MAG: aminotransferase class IV, partial [Thermoplasmata archaeon]|nr:aminotransferase class IV [Thermoplasmata archaeon]
GFLASINGHIGPAEEARVSVLDNGFTFGDSVYETLRTYGGRPFALDRHLRRLRGSAGRIGVSIPEGDEVLAERLDALLARGGNPESNIRMIVTRGVGDISYHFDRVHGPTIVFVVKPYEPLADGDHEEGVAVSVVSVRRNHKDALDPAIKSCNLLNNILAVREAQSRGALEAIMLNEAGDVAEGASSNVFVVREGVVSTPPLQAGILAGITREVILEILPTLSIEGFEERLTLPAFLGADEAFLTSTLKEAAPIRSVDGRPLGSGRPGPITRRIQSSFRERAPGYCR